MSDKDGAASAARPIGAHLPLGAGMLKAAERAGEIGATVLQIFADNPTAWRRRAEPPAELERFRERLGELGVGILAIHGPYLVNLATPDETVWERSLATLTGELRVGAGFGASVVNVHIGSHRGAGGEVGLQRIGQAVKRAFEAVPGGSSVPRLALENSAGGGDGMGVSLEELAGMLEAVAAAGADAGRLCFCLDTAHLWGAGTDVADPDAIDAFFERFDELLGAERLALVHLNDSKVGRGSHLDRHQHVGAGGIGARGLRHLLRHPRLAAVPIVIETPGMDEGYDLVNMERIRQLLGDDGELPELPADALALRRSRSRTEPPPTTPDRTRAALRG